MPTLPIYTSQSQPVGISGGRRAEGEDFSAPLGDITKAVGAAANAYLTDKEDSESRKALVASTEIRAKYAKALDQAATEGSDLTALRQQMDDELSKVGDKFETRRGQESLQLYAANTGLMFDEQANSIEVKRAASTARLEGSKFINSASAIIQSNPLYLAAAEKDADALVDTFRRISPEQKAEIKNSIKQELNMAAAISAARIDPEGTKKRLDAGEWNLSADQRATAIDKADTEIRAKRSAQEAAYVQNKREREDASDAAGDKYLKKIYEGKADFRAITREILDDPTLTRAQREHQLDNIRQRTEELRGGSAPRSDENTKMALFLAATAPDGTPGKLYNTTQIYEAAKARKLNVNDATFLSNIVMNGKNENGQKLQSSINAFTSGFNRELAANISVMGRAQARPGLVSEIGNAYARYIVDEVEKKRNTGKSGEDPSSLFDPRSKDYVGSEEVKARIVRDALNQDKAAVRAGAEAPGSYAAVPVGAAFVDPNGKTRTMTKELKAALEKQALQASGATGGF